MEKQLEKREDSEETDEQQSEGSIEYELAGFSYEKDEKAIEKRNKLFKWRIRGFYFLVALFSPIIMGFLASLLNPVSGLDVLSVSVLFIIGSLFATAYSGYKYNLDDFTSFYVGIFSYLPLAVILLGLVWGTTPQLLTFVTPLVILYGVLSGVSGVVYGALGRQMAESN